MDLLWEEKKNHNFNVILSLKIEASFSKFCSESCNIPCHYKNVALESHVFSQFRVYSRKIISVLGRVKMYFIH